MLTTFNRALVAALVVCVFLLLATLLTPASAATGITAEADGPDGSVIVLYEDAGPCVGGARRAEYVAPDGKTKTPGCWVATPRGVSVAFFDGEGGAIPATALRPPKSV